MSKLFKILLITCFGLFSFTIANANEAPVSFSDMVQKALPAVVNISATQKAEHGRKLQLHEIPENPFELFDFFQNDLNQDSPRKEYSLGSGFIIDPKGYIITNYHVVGNADVVEVGLDGEPTKRYKAKIIGKDKKTDLALLKITPDKDLPYLELGDSDKCRVGDWVITIGNPYGLGGTVTKGIISAKARQLNTGQFDDYIQTDAPINRGNSGGPMIAMDGRVIGVNTVILSPSGGSIGIGFAIPTSLVNNIITQLRDHGQVSRSWLGVKVQQVDDKIAKGMGLSSAKGALVVEVTPDSPAEKAGVMVGDIITRFNSTDINSTQKLPLVVADTPAGESVVMTVFRDKSYKNIKIKVELAPKDASETTSEDAKAPTPSYAHTTAFGLTVREVDPVLRKRYLIDQEIQGVLIAKISEAIQANDLGLRTGDVILKINQETLKSLKDFNVAMERVKESGDKAVVLLVHSRGQNRFVVLDLTE
jgi:serine protease Do